MQVIEKPGVEALRCGISTLEAVGMRCAVWDARGRAFVEEAKAVVLSHYGASILSTHKLGVEQELVVIQEHNNREAEIRVVGEIGYEDSLHTYGVTFLDPDIDFWGIEFDSATDAYTSDASMSLQCNICGRCEGIDLDGLESDIYAIHNGLIRDCKHCHRSTLWKRRPAEAPESVGAPQFVAGSAESAPPVKRAPLPAGSKNRRQHMRIKVNFTGGVRNYGSEEDIVVSDNISRGGLCFKSSRCYDKTVAIEVAAPDNPGSTDIPVSARIAHVPELPDGTMFPHGAQHLHPAKDGRSSTV